MVKRRVRQAKTVCASNIKSANSLLTSLVCFHDQQQRSVIVLSQDLLEASGVATTTAESESLSDNALCKSQTDCSPLYLVPLLISSTLTVLFTVLAAVSLWSQSSRGLCASLCCCCCCCCPGDETRHERLGEQEDIEKDAGECVEKSDVIGNGGKNVIVSVDDPMAS